MERKGEERRGRHRGVVRHCPPPPQPKLAGQRALAHPCMTWDIWVKDG